MAKSCWATIMTILGLLAMFGIVMLFNNSPLGWVLGIIVLVVVTFSDYIIFFGGKKLFSHVKEAKQKVMICPRCKIYVDKESGICPECNQKL
ncbi:MAG: hypothetical protein ACFFAS_01835 [Promethearchaeota archaeon]